MTGQDSDALHHLFQMFWDFTVWLDKTIYPPFLRKHAYDPKDAGSIWLGLAIFFGIYYYRRWKRRQDAKDRHTDMRGARAPNEKEETPKIL